MSSTFATPRTPERSEDGPSKAQLVGALAIFRILDFDPQTSTTYGTAATCKVDLVVVDGDHAGHYPDWFCAGNLARQLGDALDPGAMAPGRVVSGKSANGRDWFGVEWASAEADVAAAEAALGVGKPTTLGDKVRATTADLKAKAAPAAGDEPPPF